MCISYYRLLYCTPCIFFIVPDFSLKKLSLLKWTDSNGQPQELRLLDELSARWQEVGDLLELSPSRLDGIEVQRRCDARMCCRDVLLDWLKMDEGSYSVNWDGMLCLLKDMKLSALARILQEALEHYHH